MAAEAVAWNGALVRCGLTPASIQFLGTEGGIDSTLSLHAISLADVREMMNSIRRAAEKATVPAGAVRPSFNFLVGLRIKAFRLWIEYRVERGQTYGSALYDHVAMARFTSRLTEVQNLEASAASSSIPDPPKLASFETWETWEELFTTYLSHVRSSTLKIPFTYLIRPPRDTASQAAWEAMTAAQRTDVLDTAAVNPVDEDLISTARHSGPNFTIDNRVLFDLLKTLTIEGTCWSFLEQFNHARNGRAAFLLLKQQAEGNWAVTSKRTGAYNSISNAHFTGKGRFTFAQYTAVHNTAHNKLDATAEPVPETKKVTDFLNGINCDLLKTAKQIVISDMKYKTDFHACQQYLQSVWSELSGAEKKGIRSISQVEVNPKKGRFPHRNPRGDRNPRFQKKGKVKKDRHYSNEEWTKMKAEGKTQAIEELRKQKTAERLAREARSTAAVDTAHLDKNVIVAVVKELKAHGISIGSVQSSNDEDTAVSALTAPNGTPLKEVQDPVTDHKDAPTNVPTPQAPPKQPPIAAIPKKQQTKADFDVARLASAGGQFGRNKTKVSFPPADVAKAAATTTKIGAVHSTPVEFRSNALPGQVFPTYEAASAALAAHKATKKKKRVSPRKAMVLPTQQNKRPVIEAAVPPNASTAPEGNPSVEEGTTTKRPKRGV
jgi:hypothetical protein